MSGRVERSWPNFTNVGPSSSSIARTRWPRVEPSSASASISASRRLPFEPRCAMSKR